jgi:hypothetical protein
MMTFEIHLRDILQAFLQSDSFLQRDLYARPPKELDVPVGCIMKVLRPLYGVLESPMHWYKTYHVHHTKELCITPTATDPNFSCKTDDDRLSGVIIIQVDDSAVGGTRPFRDMEIEKSRVFPTKDPVMISQFSC